MPQQSRNRIASILFQLALPLVFLIQGCASGERGGSSGGKPDDSGVVITPQDNKIRVEINGRLFTEYYYSDVPRPFFYPLIGPGGLPMTRDWPMASPEGEEHDHPHHRSLWFAHGAVNGIDFWTEAGKFGKIVADNASLIGYDKKAGFIKTKDKWISADGKVVCTDDRIFRVYNRTNGVMFDFDVTIHASNGDVVFNDTKEGSMAVRVAESMKLKFKNGPGQGHIVNSVGDRDQDTWGKHADWCDYYGPVQGKTVGIAIFDNPSNPRHPTTWHVRDYGLFAVNPFGLHDFEKKPVGAGDLKIPDGSSVTFRYRFFLHEGNEQDAHIADLYKEYAQPVK